MPKPTKRSCLEALKRPHLIKLASQLDVDVAKSARRAILVDAVMKKRSALLREVLEKLSRDELKDICDAHNLDQPGRAKTQIITRILGQEPAPVKKRKTESKANMKTNAPEPARCESGPPLPRQLPPERVDLSKLGSHLWEAANILRGSPVDRTDWKSYILPLLFFKRICDVWDEERDGMLTKYDGQLFPDDFRFKVPDDKCPSPCTEHASSEPCRVGCHWESVRGVSKHVGKAIQNAMHGIEQANQKKLLGVFGDASWTNKERLPDDLLKDLLEHFSKLPLGNNAVQNDVMGDAYEYLIKQFADSTNKKAGEFYTPRSVVRLMVDILDPKEGETVYDPACGTGGMFLAAVEHVEAAGGDPRTFYGKLFGQEKNLTTASVARMNLQLHGVEEVDIRRGDTLRRPAFASAEDQTLRLFDIVLANPPGSLKDWGREVWESDPWGRAFAGLPTGVPPANVPDVRAFCV